MIRVVLYTEMIVRWSIGEQSVRWSTCTEVKSRAGEVVHCGQGKRPSSIRDKALVLASVWCWSGGVDAEREEISAHAAAGPLEREAGAVAALFAVVVRRPIPLVAG